jgi:toxin ParE1/3/4
MYHVSLTESARNDLFQIASFITADSGYKETATEYIGKLEVGILSLKDYPERGSIPRYKLLRLQGFRILIIESHLVFYKIIDQNKAVIVYRILHQKSSYFNFL